MGYGLRSVTQIKSHAQKFLKKIAAGENIFKMLDSPEAEGNLTMPSYDFFNVGTGSAATKGVDFKQEMLAKTYVNSGKPTRVKNPVVKNAVVINMRLLNEPEFEDMFATWKDHSLPLGAWTTGMHSLLKEKFPLLLKKYNYFDTDRRNALCQFMDKKKKSNKRKAGDGKAKTKNAQVLPPLAQLFKDNPLLAPNNTMLPPDMSALFSSNFNPAAANIVIINDSNLSAYTHTHTRIHNINNNINIINNNNTSAPIIMRLSYEPEFEDLFATWKDHSLPLGAWTTGMHSLLKEKFPLLLKKYNYFDTDRRKAFCQFLMDKKKSNRKAEVGASKGVGFKHDLLAETTKITSSTGMSAAPSHVVWSCVPQHDEYKQSDSTSNIDAYLRWENLQAPRTE
ncbi:hypothetical protein TL16_g08391 [Triparma laevis f. inornata]|uniref:Uncharacterized protein n=1 Tax=Triparma laevis f. inornata TaxID=1714386 RepID=A0A9W7EGB7_9STRA|nr:hypothetical protein TL16_g08391 [Triparma laevis f. inornata]